MKTETIIAREAERIADEARGRELGKLSVNEIAKRLMVNRSTLSRAFRSRSPWMTLQELLEINKMAEFNILIGKEEAKTVKEALEILDISDASHFIRKFKEHFKETPGNFCRRIKKIKKRGKREKKERKKAQK